jgi:hypothetical protein
LALQVTLGLNDVEGRFKKACITRGFNQPRTGFGQQPSYNGSVNGRPVDAQYSNGSSYGRPAGAQQFTSSHYQR